MELITFDEFLNKYKDTPISLTIGDFDGVHKAHEILINNTVHKAKTHNIKSVVMTFEPHPVLHFNPVVTNFIITNVEEKKYYLEKLDVDFYIIVNFTKEVSGTSKQDFITNYLDRLNIKFITLGEDFAFGKNKTGQVEDLKALTNYDIEVYDLININNNKCSSTTLRSLISQSNLEMFSLYSNHPFYIIGTVIEGSKIGRTINIPTANLKIEASHILPKNGVYECLVDYDNQTYKGLVNIGHNPTFNMQEELRFEVHILNFNQDIYGKKIMVSFTKFIREEVKFNSKEEFLKQIKLDLESIK